MNSLNKKTRIILGLVLLLLYSNSLKIQNSFGTMVSLILLVVVIAYLFLCRKYKTPEAIKQGQAEEKRRQQIAERAQAMVEAERERELKNLEEAARQDEWNRTHEVFETKIAGVTFNNEDGSSRQKYLEEFYLNRYPALTTFEDYEFNGQTAIKVFYDGKCIGNIPQANVEKVLHILDNEEIVQDKSGLSLDRFDPDEDAYYDYETGNVRSHKIKWVYRADLKLVYKKR